MNALLIFLVIVILVTAVLVYLYFNKLGPWKKEKSPALAPAPVQTQVLPSITDFSVDRTLSPDGSSESYTIEPYTIEPYTADDIIALSKNVNFTLKWTNGIGFEEAVVKEIKVYHGVMTETETEFNDWIPRKTIDSLGYLKNFATVNTSISGRDIDDTDGDPYSFEGNNFFKIVAYYGPDNNKIELELYNSYKLWKNETDENERKKLAIKISSDDLVGTLSLATPETITYKPRLESVESKNFDKEISNKRYNFYYFENVSSTNPEGKLDGKLLFGNVRLVPVGDEGTEFKLEKGDQYFKVSGTEYLFGDASTASTVYIAESREQEINKRGYEKVILLKVLISDGDKSESYYLFGQDGFKKLTDPTISTADQFFSRNIYINSV